MGASTLSGLAVAALSSSVGGPTGGNPACCAAVCLPSPATAANTKGGLAQSAYDRNQQQNPTLQTAGSRDTIKPFGCASGLVPEVPS